MTGWHIDFFSSCKDFFAYFAFTVPSKRKKIDKTYIGINGASQKKKKAKDSHIEKTLKDFQDDA